MALKNVALFGASGQIGSSILKALLDCDRQKFDVLTVISPSSAAPLGADQSNVKVKELDTLNATRKELAEALSGIDVVVSALNGKALEAQYAIQQAAADAGVKRFYPSEYGMHHIYRKPGDPMGYIHQLWDMKNRQTELIVRNPAVDAGKMSYTVIGCGDFYNQDRERVWCPWTQKDVEEYKIPVIGDPDAKADFTHLDDLGRYLVATLCEPEKSENKYLNFTSDHISPREIASLLEKASGKPVDLDIYPLEKLHEVLADAATAPKKLQGKSSFPVDFWFLVKSMQGTGQFYRPRGQNHNDLFPSIEKTTFLKYLQERFKGRTAPAGQ